MLDLEVVQKEKLTDSVVALRMAPHSPDATLPKWTPGAHLELHLTDTLVRPYSLVPNQSGYYEVAVLLEPDSRGGSSYVHKDLATGDRLAASVPRSFFQLQENGQAVLLAGGIGITPMLSIADALHEKNVDLQFHYCAKSRDQAAYIDQIQRRSWSNSLSFHASDQGCRINLKEVLEKSEPDVHFYACGPNRFLDEITSILTENGRQDQLQVEKFHSEVELTGSSFIVELASSGRRVTVAEDETILTALQREDIDIPFSCTEGICGTCETGVIEGEIDHRDLFLTEEERASGKLIMPCCSRAKGPLIKLDL